MSSSPPPRPPPAPQDPPAAPRNASAALARLNAAVEQIKELKDELGGFRRHAGTVMKALHLETSKLRAEKATLEQRVAILETALGLDVDGDSEGAADGGDVVAEAAEDATREELAKIHKSLALGDSQTIKNTVNAIFKHFMGVTTLVPEKLPPHPNFPTGEPAPAVPLDPATNKPYLRFRWDKDGKHASNIDGLQTIIAGVRTLGPALYPTSTTLLPTILDAHLKARVFTKYKYLHCEWSRGHEVDEDAEGGGREGPDGDDIFGEEPDEANGAAATSGQREKTSTKSRNKRATHNSRASATLAIRVRKRATHAEYSNAKYNSAFILNAMSEEEDDTEVQPGASKGYTSRSHDYRSDLSQRVYREVDALPDPDPDKSGRGMVRRRRGDILVGSIPPKAKHLKNRIRAWQVKPELLEQNPGWLTSGRVAANGKLWGDEKDPVDDEPKTAKRKEAPGNGAVDVVALKRKRRQVGTGEVDKHQAELDNVLGGKEVGALIDQISM